MPDAGGGMVTMPNGGFGPQITQRLGEEGRVGWGCSSTPTSDSIDWTGILILLVAFIVLRFGSRRAGIVLTALGLALACASIARADEPGPLHLSLDLVHQLAPTDDNGNGQEIARRTGGEVRVDFTLHPNFDVGAGSSIGEDPGFRAVLTFHTMRNGGLSWFAQPRFIVHPKGFDDAGLGGGFWTGAAYDLGPGRFEFGPALEFYTSPGNVIQNYTVLLIGGYQFDLLRKASKPAPSPAPAPVASKPDDLIPIPLPEPQPAPEPTPPSEKITLSASALFKFDSYDLRPEAKATLDDLSAKLPAGALVTIVGHTCNVGTHEYNVILSWNRAWSVENYLKAKRNDVTTNARGAAELEPVASNKTKAGRKANRRVEITIEYNK
jgi:outer membrane protein OmpA-like peptidoglycan-associated protein